jgi:AraC-like DNA-binding protein
VASEAPDLLADLLSSARFRSITFWRSELTAPWGVGVEAKDVATFHILLEGGAWLDVEEPRQTVSLGSGDLLILPRGHAHTIRDGPRSSVTALKELLRTSPLDAERRLCHGGGGAKTVVLCGGLVFEDGETNPLRLSLPAVMHLRGEEGHTAPSVERALQGLLTAARAGGPGADTVMARLADVLFIEAIRSYVGGAAPASREAWPALQDPRVMAALALIHGTPEHRWTVARLAAAVGMSRTSLATRFARLVGEPVLHYVTRCRMQRATAYLRATAASMGQVAERVGYESEAAFKRAFKRRVGLAPGAFRRQGGHAALPKGTRASR